MSNNYWIKNVRLETGYDKDSEGYTITKTDLFSVFIEDGKIAKVIKSSENIETGNRIFDGKGLLMIPSYTEKHVHIDKTNEGEKWRAVTAERNIIDIVTSEAKLYPTYKTSIESRATNLINTFIKNGSTHIRTHVDIVNGLKLNHLEGVVEAFGNFGDYIDYDIVAFPQHGLIRSDSYNALDNALKNGATILGGLDPFTIDNDREKSLNQTMELAVKHNVNIDYHHHEPAEIGYESFIKFAELIKEAKWQNRVTISHALFLRDISEEKMSEVAEIMLENGIDLVSSVPLDGRCPKFTYFDSNGIKIGLGCDTIHDSWSPFGNGNVLEKLGYFDIISGIRKEDELSQSLKYITNYVTPLNDKGEMVWPKVSDKADFLLVDAVSSANVVGRRLPNKLVVNNGNFLYGSI